MKYVIVLFVFSVLGMPQDIRHRINQHTINQEKELAVVVPTYNNSRWCIKNISSILSQKYANYHVYIIDDCSTDDTFEQISTYLENHPLAYKVTLHKNQVRLGATANWYNTISQLKDHVIVLNNDGDDWLAHDLVFSRLNQVYSDQRIWMTFGQFRVWPHGYDGFCKRHSPRVVRNNAYRRSEWLSSHLRTYYVWLFKKIDVQDLMFNGEFMPTTCDRAIMYPLLEMCAGHYYCFEDEILYIYNQQNPLADLRVNKDLQKKICDYIIGLPPYKALADTLVTL